MTYSPPSEMAVSRLPFISPAQANVGPAARHIRGNGDRSHGTGVCDDPGLQLVVLCVQHVAWHASCLQAFCQFLRFLHARCTDKHRTAGGMDLGDFRDAARCFAALLRNTRSMKLHILP